MTSSNPPFISPLRRHAAFVLAVLLALALPARASDHADPIHLPMGKEFFDDGKPNAAAIARAAGNTTDLFVFPLKEDGTLADFPETPGGAIGPAEQSQIKALAVILCVRPGLRKKPPVVDLSTFTYQIHMDLHSPVTLDPKSSEFARYGGSIPDSTKIDPDVTFEFQLNDDTTLKKKTITAGPNARFANPDNVHVYDATSIKTRADEIKKYPKDIHLYTGYQDDPFIFPRFFGSNVVAMVMIVPTSCFLQDQRNFVVWANTHKDGKQIDHVGRSLRTQNPRFEIFNPLPPKEHVAAVKKAHDNPTLKDDLFIKLGFDNFFEYRPWDYVPDVMIYSSQFNVGYPNGRRLTDDVANLLARNGDTLLYELSYKGAVWPRKTANDKEFLPQFPFLAEPWPDSPVPAGPALSAHNQRILRIGLGLAIAVALLGIWKLAELIVKFVRMFIKKPIRA